MHGGKVDGNGAPKGNKNSLKFGIYGDGLDDDEKELWHDIEIGKVEDELRVCRLRLRRALRAQKQYEGDEVIVERPPDFDQIIDRYLGRIANLEKSRLELLQATGDGDTADDIARRIKSALNDIDDITAEPDAEMGET